MSHPFSTKGSVTLQIGKGHLTRYEINTLSEGDVVELYHRAGESFPVEFNGNVLGKGEIVVLDNTFGVRLVSVGGEEDIVPAPLRTDDLTNVLPISVALDPVPLSIQELSGAGPATVLVFDQKYDNAFTLRALGLPIARGNIVVVEENFGIRIKEVLHRASEPGPVELSGRRLGKSEDFRPIKDYDFKRPDKFSRQHILAMQKIHALFAASLALSLPEARGLSVLSVDQGTFSEFEDSMKSKPHSFFLLKTGLPGSPPSGEKRDLDKLLIVPEKSESPVAKDQKGWLEMMKKHWEKSSSAVGHYDQFLFAFEAGGLFSKLASPEAVTELFVQPLHKGWKSAMPMSVRLEKTSGDPKEMKIVPANDMVVLVEVGVAGHPEIHGNFLYPFIALEPILPYLR